jgi:hypothetical protein
MLTSLELVIRHSNSKTNRFNKATVLFKGIYQNHEKEPTGFVKSLYRQSSQKRYYLSVLFLLFGENVLDITVNHRKMKDVSNLERIKKRRLATAFSYQFRVEKAL